MPEPGALLRLALAVAFLCGCPGTSGGADGGSCQVATDCPAIACQCAGGRAIASDCLCQGGVGPNGCLPGGVCATPSDCGTACAQGAPPGGGNSGGGGGADGGGQLCQSDHDCPGSVICACEAGTVQLGAKCQDGVCTPPPSCSSC